MLRFNSTVETLRLGGPLEEPADPVGRGDTLRSGLTEEDGNSANSTRVLFSPSSTSAALAFVSSEGASEGGEQKLSEARNVASTKEEDAAAVRRELFLRLLFIRIHQQNLSKHLVRLRHFWMHSLVIENLKVSLK